MAGRDPAAGPRDPDVRGEEQRATAGGSVAMVASSISRLWISGRVTYAIASATNEPNSAIIDIDAM